jgi:large subunit ribosomal protein L10e
MRNAFGKAVGTAARVHSGDIIMVGRTTPDRARILRDALHKASIKLPTPCKIEITKGKDLAGKLGL